MYGGFTNAWLDGDRAQSVRHEVHPSVVPITAVPAFKVPTLHARSALAPTVSRADASFNISRAALLVHALTNDPSLLLPATQDHLHQDARRAVYAESMELVDVLRAQGLPAVISGAGPTVLVFGAASDLEKIAIAAGEQWQVSQRAVSRQGVQISPVSTP